MSFQFFVPWSFLSLLCFLSLFLVKIQPSLSNPEYYRSCRLPFKCGEITADFPFWGDYRPKYCGHPDLQLNCEKNLSTMRIGDAKYRVLDVDQKEQVLSIARQDSFDGLCPRINTIINKALFDSAGYQILKLLYGCPASPEQFTCHLKDVIFYTDGFRKTRGNTSLQGCNRSVDVPVSKTFLPAAKWNITALEEALYGVFKLKWNLNPCDESCSSCGYGIDKKAVCYCPDGQLSNSTRCSTSTAVQAPKGSQDSPGKKISAAGVGVAVASVAVISLGVCCFLIIRQRRKIAAQNKSRELQTPPSSRSVTATTTRSSQSIPPYPYSNSDLGKRSTYFGAQVFSYAELEKATENFNASKELGDGGFGTVYYGVLRDGRVVAVKRLYENNIKRAQQFKNEIEILTRLQHPNLVKLYGCTSRHSRELLLVYEYIPNGTVADHLHGRQSNSGLLPWPVRLSIAIETADALAYLHTSDVIHRDVKSNNILLDNYFCVKVADFGLSRLFPTDVTHVSTAPQGTLGYVDPEYYQCYKLTDKSDVYSFGVVLIELISGLQAVDTNRQRLDINLSNMAVNKIQNHALNELVDPFLGFEKDYTVRSMVTSVAELAFRCLQQDREMRPTMQEVVEILKGIRDEHSGTQKSEVMDIFCEDDAVLLKNNSPPLTPGSETDKWVSSSTTSSSS